VPTSSPPPLSLPHHKLNQPRCANLLLLFPRNSISHIFYTPIEFSSFSSFFISCVFHPCCSNTFFRGHYYCEVGSVFHPLSLLFDLNEEEFEQISSLLFLPTLKILHFGKNPTRNLLLSIFIYIHASNIVLIRNTTTSSRKNHPFLL